MAYQGSPGQLGTGQAPSYGNWPVRSDAGATLLRADTVAGVLLILGGLAGILQLFVTWSRTTVDSGSTTGWQLFQLIKHQTSGSGFSLTFAAYAIIAVAVVGVAMLLLGVAMFLPMDHRPPGVVAMLAAVIAIVCAAWWVFWGPTGGISAIFSRAGIGWYLLLAAGIVGLIGAIKSLVSSAGI